MVLKVKKSERFYFLLKVIFTIIPLLGVSGFIASEGTKAVATFSIFAMYLFFFIMYSTAIRFLMNGYLRGNGVRVTESQFPEVHQMILEIASEFNMKKIPEVFLVQSGGALNAFATRFAGRNYIAVYSEVFSLIENDPSVLKFVLAHELAHIKRKHLQKHSWTFLSFYVPFLNAAYSRSCEHTCDGFANGISREGALKGLTLLASGRELYKKIDVETYLRDYELQNSLTVKIAEKFFSHPTLPNRIKYLTLI